MKNKGPLKIAFLIGVGLFLVIYCYLRLLSLPLMSESRVLASDANKLKEVIRTQSLELRRLLAEEESERANQPLDRLVEHLLETVPKSHLVTCPERFLSVTKRHGFQGAKVRLSHVLPFATLPNALRDVWSITISSADSLKIGEMIAEMENEFPLGQLISIALHQEKGSDLVNTEIKFQLVVLQ